MCKFYGTGNFPAKLQNCKKFVCFEEEHYRIVGLEKYQSKDWVLYFFAEGGITPMILSEQKSNRRHSMNLLEVNGILKTYGVGEAGSDKSTLLNLKERRLGRCRE